MSNRKFNEIFHDSGSFKKMKHYQNVQITPELATALLRINTENRPYHKNTLRKYKADMLSGEWKFIGDSIRISKTGKLMDGQHRLKAVVETGVTIVSHIQTGLEPEVFTVMDTGTVRTAGDIAALAGYKYHSYVTSISDAIITIKEDPNRFEASRRHQKKKSHKQNIAMLESLDKNMLEEAAALGHRIRSKAKFLDLITVAVIHYVLTEGGRADKSAQFFELLATGDGLGSSSHSAVWLLRNKLIENMSATAKLTIQAKFSLIVNTWNAFLKGKSLSRLPKITEDTPALNV